METAPKTPAEILQAALAREKQAHDFYQDSAMQCKIPMVRELFEALMNEESRHIKLIQGMIAKFEIS
jgi:rubrerythrin